MLDSRFSGSAPCFLFFRLRKCSGSCPSSQGSSPVPHRDQGPQIQTRFREEGPSVFLDNCLNQAVPALTRGPCASLFPSVGRQREPSAKAATGSSCQEKHAKTPLKGL